MTASKLVTPNAPNPEWLGRYRLVAQLGQGGMGTIQLAVTTGLGDFRKLLVVKELQRDLARNRQFVEMFMAEAMLAARLDHPNIVQTFEAGAEQGRYFLSMEFLDGQPLTQLLIRATREPVFTLGMRIQLLCDVLLGLHYAHELCDYDGTPFELVHRDVSPQNVFVTYHGQVKLVDFGIAKAADVDAKTGAGVFKGKFSYASPEQVRGEGVDRRSDLFAAGVMLWEMISLRRFAPGTPTQTAIERRLAGSEPRILEIATDIDPLLAEICDRAIHVDPQQRYATAELFRADLQKYLLVVGEEPSLTLADLMCQKFAAERAEMRHLIDVHAKRDERLHSSVRDLPHVPEAARSGESRDKSTLIGDLSSLVEKTRAGRRVDGKPIEWQGSLRRSGRPYVWAGLAALLVLGGVAWLRFDGRRAPAGRSVVAAKEPAQALPAAGVREEVATTSAGNVAGEQAAQAALPASEPADTSAAAESAQPADPSDAQPRAKSLPFTAASGSRLSSRSRASAEPAERASTGDSAEPGVRSARWRGKSEHAPAVSGQVERALGAGTARTDTKPAGETLVRGDAPGQEGTGARELELREVVRPRRARGIDLQDPYQ
jgi:serine/threonine protein kinase